MNLDPDTLHSGLTASVAAPFPLSNSTISMTTLSLLPVFGSDTLEAPFALATIAVTVLSAAWLLHHRRSQTAKPAEPADSPTLSPEIAPAEHHREAIAHLERLPQFFRRIDDTLIDWTTGAEIQHCECRDLPFKHLKVTWSGGHSVGFRTRNALTHFVALQVQRAMLLNAPLLTIASGTPTTSADPSVVSPVANPPATSAINEEF